MSLIQLTAKGPQNSRYNIPRNLAIEYFTEDFVNNSFNMKKSCDTKLPEYLEIELLPNINIYMFKTICHKVCFEMTIGGSKILSIPLRFMIHHKNYEICDNKIYVTIPFELFCNDIKLICLQFHEVRFTLTNIENVFKFCKLISKGIFYDSEIRSQMSKNQHDEIIQQLASIEITSPNPKNEFKYVIPFKGIHKGFYIECENIDKINEISLNLNHLNKLIYNYFFVKTKCVKISQQLLYLPFNFDKLCQDRLPTGFEGSINLSRVDSVVLNIKLYTLNYKICLYGLSSNILRTCSNMGGLAFFYENNNHYYCDYQKNGDYIENIIYKLITDNDKIICCILHETIDVNNRYMSCVNCNNNYNEISIKQWFRQTPHQKTCPMCRANWTNFIIYINSEEPILF